VLPELETLTKLAVPEMLFPLRYNDEKVDPIVSFIDPITNHARHLSKDRGYHYRLENVLLIVTKLGIEEKSPIVYKISEDFVVPTQPPAISKEISIIKREID
jgi:hypothetical protein